MSAIRIIQVDSEAHIQQLRDLLNEYMTANRRLAPPDFDMSTVPTFKNLDDELATLPGIFAPPGGRFLVALDDDRVIGCVALKPVSETVSELKRMYVTPGYRGQQIGWRLVEALVAEARQIGNSRIILDSHPSMTKAHGVYAGVGFKRVPPPDDAPEFMREAVFMEMDLTGA